jgi:hypothetical protein
MDKLKIAIFCLLLAYPASTAAQEVSSIEIVSYGIFTGDLQSQTRDGHGLMKNLTSNVQQTGSTTTIPAQPGLRFGVEYKVNGPRPDTTVTLERVTIFPPGGLRSAQGQPIESYRYSIEASVGAVTYAGYRFDDAWELVPGPWSIQLWYEGRMLAEQRFTIVAP